MAHEKPTHPTESGYYVCCVPSGTYQYVLLNCDPADGPYVLCCGSTERIDPATCTSWSKMAPAPAGKAHHMFGHFGHERPTKAFHFGCIPGSGSGHVLWERDSLGLLRRAHDRYAGPWSDGDIDCKLQPGCIRLPDGRRVRSAEPQSCGMVHQRDGWTALAIWDRTGDPRGGCNSNFIFDVIVTFDEAVALARELFPTVVERIESAAKIHEPAGL